MGYEVFIGPYSFVKTQDVYFVGRKTPDFMNIIVVHSVEP